jgi:hypothetical protein
MCCFHLGNIHVPLVLDPKLQIVVIYGYRHWRRSFRPLLLQEACDRFGDVQVCRSLVHRKSPFWGDSLNQRPPG